MFLIVFSACAILAGHRSLETRERRTVGENVEVKYGGGGTLIPCHTLIKSASCRNSTEPHCQPGVTSNQSRAGPGSHGRLGKCNQA